MYCSHYLVISVYKLLKTCLSPSVLKHQGVCPLWEPYTAPWVPAACILPSTSWRLLPELSDIDREVTYADPGFRKTTGKSLQKVTPGGGKPRG